MKHAFFLLATLAFGGLAAAPDVVLENLQMRLVLSGDGYAKSLGEGLNRLTSAIDVMENALGGLHEGIVNAIAALRKEVDALEKLVSDELWPLPKYREMLFIY